MGVQIVEASADRVVGTMPVEGNTQPYGLLHGGASAVLAETLGSVGAMLHGGSSKIAVGVDLNCTHHRGARSGLVTGVATPVHRGRVDGDVRGRDHGRGRQAGVHSASDMPAAGRAHGRLRQFARLRRPHPAPASPGAAPPSPATVRKGPQPWSARTGRGSTVPP